MGLVIHTVIGKSTGNDYKHVSRSANFINFAREIPVNMMSDKDVVLYKKKSSLLTWLIVSAAIVIISGFVAAAMLA